jgi:hypothetical protein
MLNAGVEGFSRRVLGEPEDGAAPDAGQPAGPGDFAIRLEGQKEGELFWLPPDIRAFQDAQPGEYRLRSTGEIVVDPDFITNWTINHPPPS